MPRRKKNAQREKLPRRPIVADGRCWLTGKYGYKTAERAEQALAEVREKRLSRGQVKNVENRVIVPAHEVCGMFHLTHLTEEQYAAEQKRWGTGDQA